MTNHRLLHCLWDYMRLENVFWIKYEMTGLGEVKMVNVRCSSDYKMVYVRCSSDYKMVNVVHCHYLACCHWE